MIEVQNIEQLRSWLTVELEPICDADPGVLAKYILALIRRDKDEEVLKQKCSDSLDVFLGKETEAFVEKLIHALVNKSYVQEEYDPTDWNGLTPNSPKKEETEAVAEEQKEEVDPSEGKKEAKEEAEEVRDEPTVEEVEISVPDDKKSLKRAGSFSSISSAGSGANDDSPKAKEKSRSRSRSKDRDRSKRSSPSDKSKRKKKRKHREEKHSKKRRKEKREKCPDYEEKGFCKKGDSCPYDHGSDPYKVDTVPVEPFMQSMFPAGFPAFPPGMPFPFPPPGMMPLMPPPNFTSPVKHDRRFDGKKRQASENIISLTNDNRYDNSKYHNNDNNHQYPKRSRFTPWVKGKGTPDNCTLELRKVPQEMNTEDKLREHFEKFGTINKVIVGINGDMQAAVIEFASHSSARNACSAPEPVFNNRFIALFWHAGGSISEKTNEEKSANAEVAQAEQMALLQKVKQQPLGQQTQAVTRAQRVALAKSKMFSGINPAAMQAYQEAQEEIKQQRIESAKKQIQAQEEARKKKEEQRQAAIKMKTSLIEQKRELLAKYLEEQKKLLSKLESGKSTLSANDKKSIMETMKVLEESCKKLKTEIDELLVVAKPKPPKPQVPVKPPPDAALMTSSPLQKHKQETQKELLDAELELLTDSDKNAEEKLRLQKKLIELKKEAVLLGLMGRSKPNLAAMQPPAAIQRQQSGGPQTSPMFQQTTPPTSLNSLDHRPKTIKVSGFNADEKADVIAHFSKLGKVDKQWEDGSVLFFEYKNRKDSLNAAQNGFRFKSKTLTVHWHRGSQRISSTSQDDVTSSPVTETSRQRSDSGADSSMKADSSRGDSFVGLTEEDEQEAERFWRLTANANNSY